MPTSTQNPLELSLGSSESSRASKRTAQQEKRSTRRQVMVFLVFVQILVFVWLIPKDPVLAWRFNYMLHPVPVQPVQDYSVALRKDPGIGSFPLVTGEKTPLSAVQESRSGYLVVPVGDCAGCIAVDLRQWQQDANSHKLSMFLLTSASQKQADHFKQHRGLSVPIIADPKGTLIAPLNVIWPGRAYLFSPKWRLLWMQREHSAGYNPFKDTEFLQALHGAEQ